MYQLSTADQSSRFTLRSLMYSTREESIAKLHYQAVQIVQTSHGIQDIQRVCQFCLEPDDRILEATLQRRWEPRLQLFLEELGVQSKSLNREQKIEVLLRKHIPPVSSLTFNSRWVPSDVLYETNVGIIATTVDHESLSHFRNIPFGDWVKQACNIQVASLAGFMKRHCLLREEISNHLHRFPHSFEKYARVEMVSSFTYVHHTSFTDKFQRHLKVLSLSVKVCAVALSNHLPLIMNLNAWLDRSENFL